MRRIHTFFLFLALFMASTGCEQEEPVNPFDGQVVNQDTVKLEIIDADPNSIAGIYQNILKPTCANSGCHDGTFEPDYRTLESAYNTLVYQVPIKNDGNYDYRVEPYNPQRSVLMARLNNLLTPAMPIQVDPGSDWPAKQAQYIENIRTWIANGAPDITGNVRDLTSPAPQLLGAAARIADEPVVREGGTGPLLVAKASQPVRYIFAFDHEAMDPVDFINNRIAFSTNPDDFTGAIERPLQVLDIPVNERGFYGTLVKYTHYVDIDPVAELGPDPDQWYFRVYVQDQTHPVTEIPTDNGIFYIKRYMSFRWAQ